MENEQFGASAQTELPASASVAPGETFAWDVPMTAPTLPGTYRGYWRMNHAGHSRFGDKVWVEIVVVSGPAPDAGVPDTGTSDTGTPDTGTEYDAGRPDGSTEAGSWPDGATSDAGGVSPWPEGGALPEAGGGASDGGYYQADEEASGCACGLGACGRSGPGAASLALAFLLAVAGRRRTRRVGG